ncbi:RrF2 family transcriptional regulator [Paenibacillus sp. GCM10027627]|uniref:RrF2 family transcriptional regulator n=1 Tax=unclassified Paenibacillus TaxID=185978 RepID=UPI0036450775
MRSEFTVAVHCLALLAYLPEHRASSELLACNVATNPTRVRKIMSALRKEGFVKTKEGIGGGYQLNCIPEEVTLAEIYRSICGGTLKPHWSSGNPEETCLVSANMSYVMDGFFREAEQHYEEYLERHTLQTVLDRLKRCCKSKQEGGEASVNT